MDENPQKPDDLWSVIGELASLDKSRLFKESTLLGMKASREDCLRRALRPHDDAGFVTGDRDLMTLRARLDKALEELTFREIRRELGLPNDPLHHEVRDHLLDLFGSGAFLRYVNAYLYFGVRFLPCTDEFQKPERSARPGAGGGAKSRRRTPECPEANEPEFRLMPPPAIPNTRNAANQFDAFLRLWNHDRESGEVAEALQFLDDYHVVPDKPEIYELEEPTAFELWLRGLRPEIDTLQSNARQKGRFERIRAGLSDWVLNRCAFYLALNPDEHEEMPVKNEGPLQGAQRRPQTQQVRSPIAGRLALNDLYWIARLLRADVGPNGWVHYKKNNWLQLLRFNAILLHEPMEEVLRLRRAEDTLRSVFDLVLDLVQNAMEVSALGNPNEDAPESTWRWRAVFDEELDEIEKQRRIRHFRDPSLPPEFGNEAADLAEFSNRPEREPEPPPSGEVGNGHPADSPTQDAGCDPRGKYWSRRIVDNKQPENLIGLCFSGGGIRSATLNLGVLQGLQELDLLRHFDYLSTVSGGGFIGSWLVGNVRRSQYWLGRRTDWNDSIRHLRDYSNYLAPRTGVLSADTWNLANSWIRNTFLIQITGIVWLFALLLTGALGMRAFLYAGAKSLGAFSAASWITYLVALIVAIAVSYYLINLSIYVTKKRGLVTRSIEGGLEWLGQIAQTLRAKMLPFLERHSGFGNWVSRRLRAAAQMRETLAGGGWVLRIGVFPSWLGAWALASCLWFHAPLHEQQWFCLDGVSDYSDIVQTAWMLWLPIMVPAAAGFAILAWNTLRWRKFGFTCLVVAICTIVLYLELAAIFCFFRIWSGLPYGSSLAYVFGPALVLVAFAVCILLLIGLTGKNTNEAQREWWTRFGTWLGIFTGVGVFITGVAIFGPWMILGLFKIDPKHGWLHDIQWTAVAGWIGTVISGLLAGNSSKTSGEAGNARLEILARAGGFLFILGSFLLGSTLLYVLLFEIFGPDNPLILSDSRQTFCTLPVSNLLIALGIILVVGVIFSRYFEINIFGLSQFYRNRLVRCYLGATRWMRGNRRPNEFTKFDFRDDLGLWRFRTDSPGEAISREGDKGDCDLSQAGSRDGSPYRGPFPIINCSLNLGGSSDLALNTRRGASFTLTSLRCGSDQASVGYAPTLHKVITGGRVRFEGGFANGLPLGQAVAVSGAAVSANMGYNTSPLVAFLLTMFNVRLGWWFPNPGRLKWQSRGLTFSLGALCRELFGMADDKSSYINVSDGGHFENLAIYELIRRRCKLIVACDAEADEEMQFGGLGKMIRLCQTDFGAVIDLDVKSIRPQDNGYSQTHCAVGLIKYCTGEIGHLIYLKASVTGDEDVSIAQYRSTHPSFPHESTANQFYSEDQFESYRNLGLHMVRKSFQGVVPGDDPFMIAERMFDLLAPAGPPSEKFMKHARILMELWEKFRATPKLLDFMRELITLAVRPNPTILRISNEELCIGLELIQLMEDVFLDLRLDDFWEHPDNRGWAILFMRWARSPRFRKIWSETRRTFGIRFEYFCSTRLGLERDNPIVRV